MELLTNIDFPRNHIRHASASSIHQGLVFILCHLVSASRIRGTTRYLVPTHSAQTRCTIKRIVCNIVLILIGENQLRMYLSRQECPAAVTNLCNQPVRGTLVFVATMRMAMLAMHKKMHQRAGQQYKVGQHTQHMHPVVDNQKRCAYAKQAPDSPMNAFPKRGFFICRQQ